MGLCWAALWAAIGVVVALWPGTLSAPFWIPPELKARLVAQFTAHFAALGFLGGTTFSLILAAVEGRRGFHQMSLARFAGWGALGGLAMLAARDGVGHFMMHLLAGVGLGGVNWLYAIPGAAVVWLGAGSAAATLVLARSVSDDESTGAHSDEESSWAGDDRPSLLSRALTWMRGPFGSARRQREPAQRGAVKPPPDYSHVAHSSPPTMEES